MGAIFKREFKSFFNSSVGYVILAMFIGFSAYFFTGTCFLYDRTVNMKNTFLNMFFILLFLTPILTMKSFSEERRQRTDQALLTAPVSLIEIVMGKYLSAMALYTACCAVFPVYGFILTFYGTPQWSVIFCSTLGFVLLGATLIAIDMFISSLTESQIISAILGMAVGLFVYLLPSITATIKVDWVAKGLKTLTFSEYFQSFTYGLLDPSGIVFFLSITGLFIFLTARVLEKRRWS